jgi:hypothetical protein
MSSQGLGFKPSTFTNLKTQKNVKNLGNPLFLRYTIQP